MQLEDQLEREKKARGDVDRVKRKLEQDLKQTQEAVDDMQRVKRELEEQLRKCVLSTALGAYCKAAGYYTK